MSAVFEHVEQLVTEHAELEIAIADPSVHSDQGRARTLNRRYAEITPTVRAFKEWKQLGEDIAAAQEFLAEDPSFREEIVTITAQREEVEATLAFLFFGGVAGDAELVEEGADGAGVVVLGGERDG